MFQDLFISFLFAAIAVALIIGFITLCVKKPVYAAAIVSVILTIAGFIFLPDALADVKAPEGFYPRAAIVVELRYEEDVVIVEDGAGLIWEFSGIEDFDVGDTVAMLMFDNGTPESIYDDQIVLAYYSAIRGEV